MDQMANNVTEVKPGSTERFSVFQLIVLVLKPVTLLFWFISLLSSASAVFSQKALINTVS